MAKTPFKLEFYNDYTLYAGKGKGQKDEKIKLKVYAWC